MAEFNSSLLERLTGVFGPSGQETLAAQLIAGEIRDYVDEVYIDTLGNLIAHRAGEGRRVMFSAHMDQVGFIITDIDEKGMLRFSTVGGHSPAVVFGQRVVFESGVEGTVGNERLESVAELKGDKLYIDIGVGSREEAERLVSVGDMCITQAPYHENGDTVIARTLDDRVGCYILIEAIKAQTERRNDVYYVFSTQEEVGMRGAKTAGYAVEPELCIAIDVTHTGDTHNGNRMPARLGGGAAIKLKDGSVITHPEVKRLLVELCEREGIKYQYDILAGGGTDAGSVHMLRTGVPSGGISIPTRWIHTPSEMVSKFDVTECVRLVTAVAGHEF